MRRNALHFLRPPPPSFSSLSLVARVQP
uniref:Uncharacterized protein n=1 Tax=Anguilla anguilla TaxID=7936 RepID=A0A0E9T4E4_ANGAN